MALDAWALREIYRKKLVRMKKWPRDICEELAQEMIYRALLAQWKRGVPFQNCSIKWLLADALKSTFGATKNHEPLYDVIKSTEDMEEWFAENWCFYETSNGGAGKPRARYLITANGIELQYDANELKELLSINRVEYSRSIVANFLKRGAKFFLKDGALVRSSHHAIPDATPICLKFVRRTDLDIMN